MKIAHRSNLVKKFQRAMAVDSACFLQIHSTNEFEVWCVAKYALEAQQAMKMHFNDQ
jgi:hypothetical protein